MNEETGIALLCDSQGVIVDVLRNPPDLEISARPGMLFTRLAAAGSLARALTFLATVRSQGVVFDQEINISADGQIKTLHFVGRQLDEQILIVGSQNKGSMRHLYEEMILINNEQTNALRSALKEMTQNDNIYDEISRLNNELMTAQRELAKSNADLKRLNSEKNHFLGMAAHDLRNPLHTILMHSEFLMDEVTGAEQREFLQVISAASRFMAQLVDDLLDVAVIESGELKLDYTPVNLIEFMQRSAALNCPLAVRKGVHLDYADAPPLRVLVDSAKLAQVLNNLVGNAIKFSQPGRRVVVSVQETQAVAAAGAGFLIRVADEGPGISPEQMARLFQPFQPGRQGSQGEKSTGLGLVIVKRIVEGHGGKIWLESLVGQGTTFFVSIPIQPPTV